MPLTYKPTNVVNSPFIRYSGTSAYNNNDNKIMIIIIMVIIMIIMMSV